MLFSSVLTIPVAREKIRVKLALAIPPARTILVHEIIHTPPLATLKTTKTLSM